MYPIFEFFDVRVVCMFRCEDEVVVFAALNGSLERPYKRAFFQCLVGKLTCRQAPFRGPIWQLLRLDAFHKLHRSIRTFSAPRPLSTICSKGPGNLHGVTPHPEGPLAPSILYCSNKASSLVAMFLLFLYTLFCSDGSVARL